MQKLLLLIPAVLGCVLLSACSAPTPAAPASPPATTPATASGVACAYEAAGKAAKPVSPPPTAGVSNTGTLPFVLRINDQQVAVTLDREHAPCTVNSFVSLAAQGYFDGTSCHRLVDSGSLFVLQCGDPTGTGSGGPGYQFADELSGSETYPAGTLAMANAGPGTNGSQFFIVYADSQLPPNYTVFGRTDAAGIKALADVAAGGQDGSYPDGSGKPVKPAVITSAKAA